MTLVAPGIDRGSDRRDGPRDPGRPEPETTPRDARWAALVDGLPDAFIEPDATPESIAERPPAEAADDALRARAMAGEEAPVRRRPSDAGREP